MFDLAKHSPKAYHLKILIALVFTLLEAYPEAYAPKHTHNQIPALGTAKNSHGTYVDCQLFAVCVS